MSVTLNTQNSSCEHTLEPDQPDDSHHHDQTVDPVTYALSTLSLNPSKKRKLAQISNETSFLTENNETSASSDGQVLKRRRLNAAQSMIDEGKDDQEYVVVNKRTVRLEREESRDTTKAKQDSTGSVDSENEEAKTEKKVKRGRGRSRKSPSCEVPKNRHERVGLSAEDADDSDSSDSTPRGELT
jgi:hypothetical protein